MKTSLFNHGQLVATPGAIELMFGNEVAPSSLIVRHVTGDWGELDREDKDSNDFAVGGGSAHPECVHRRW